MLGTLLHRPSPPKRRKLDSVQLSPPSLFNSLLPRPVPPIPSHLSVNISLTSSRISKFPEAFPERRFFFSRLSPLCHPLSLDRYSFSVLDSSPGITLVSRGSVRWKNLCAGFSKVSVRDEVYRCTMNEDRHHYKLKPYNNFP